MKLNKKIYAKEKKHIQFKAKPKFFSSKKDETGANTKI